MGDRRIWGIEGFQRALPYLAIPMDTAEESTGDTPFFPPPLQRTLLYAFEGMNETEGFRKSS